MTAVELLERKIMNTTTNVYGQMVFYHEEFKLWLDEAKAMEKEQIINAYTADCDTLGHTNAFKVAAEQYYNETFKSE